MAAESFPLTAWILIAQHLADSPKDLRKLSTLSPALQRLCRPLFSVHFEYIKGDSVTLCRQFPWHDALMLCLQGHLDPLFIHQAAYYENRCEFTATPVSRPALESCSEEDVRNYDHMYKEAAARFFIGADLEEICYQFSAGSTDAALAVLLPLCGRLKTFEISPWDDFHFLHAVVLDSVKKTWASGITSEQARRSAKQIADQDLKHTDLIRRRFARPDTNTVPFSELLTLWSNAWERLYNAPLQGFLPFMCIPSLHRIVLGAMKHEHSVVWPDALKCHCPEIYFAHSSVGLDTLKRVIDGIDGGCDIKQWYMVTEWEDSDSSGPEWDHAVISFGAQGEKIVSIREDYMFGQSGYQHGWVCYLHYELMHRWNHLDVEQLPLPSAYYDEWMGGPGAWS